MAALEESWAEVCERHARLAAGELAKAVGGLEGRPGSREVVRRFVDTFVEEAETQLVEAGGGGSPRASFLRRLSFKGLRLFQRSEETADTGRNRRLAKIVVECRKEGIVNYVLGEQLDGREHKWEKCRLALVKTVGGYMLEFYSPPKASKPKSGVFCFLIAEARETRALEMPDRENTFVLRAENNMEYIIEAHDADDMRSWLATIKYCMRTTSPDDNNADGQDVRIRVERGSRPEPIPSHNTAASSPAGSLGAAENPPELPPRVPGGLRLSSNSNFELCSSQQELEMMAEATAVGTEPDNAVVLREYPWFHGTLARSEAAQLVLSAGANGHGVFLVRQSETRRGEFVLTFNFQGRAKHLRMTLSGEGQCRVQHLWFASIFDMLDHFRINPIPLESGGASDVTLADFVVAGRTAASGAAGSGGSGQRPAAPPEPREQVVTHGGSVRTRTESMERLERQAAGGRAVENTYSFV
ncbi:SH2B adapter protein 1 isoform X2 [Neocloeon triangulifer]|uniref:SH2B adapter protein 1 isoform X2 n=1 Tax=Neocloeon triangulifer TaxID=2078957 RepID=UPI00286F8B84|nr:SH2B adapter protein 1 isoform X2 [Neocloeon triangulifer]